MFKKKSKGEEAAAAATPSEAGEGDALAIEGGEPKKKGLPLKMLIIAGAAGVLVLGGGGAGAVMLLGHKDPAKAGDHKEKPKKKKGEKEGEAGKPDKNGVVVTDGPDGVVFYTLPDMVVNMQTADGKPTFLKLKLTFELPDHDVVEALSPNQPRLQDMFTTFLRELRPEDLAGSQGSYQLRLEILRRVNLVIAPAKINAVLVEEMLVN